MYRRKGAGDDFSSYDESKKYFVCEHHLKADEIRVSNWSENSKTTLPYLVYLALLHFRT